MDQAPSPQILVARSQTKVMMLRGIKYIARVRALSLNTTIIKSSRSMFYSTSFP